MKILLTNDDGIMANGLILLSETLSVEHDLSIVAPDTERSAVSHGLTIHTPLFVSEVKVRNITGFSVSGTPADCVKLGIDKLVKSRPDLIISGINKGANTGLNVFYSGTVAGAMEGSFAGIPAIAVSINSFQPRDYRFCARFISHLINVLPLHMFPDHVMLNINVPDLDESDIKGMRLTHQSFNRFRDCYEHRVSPGGVPYYWLDGEYPESILDTNSDEGAVANGMISITPLRSDYNVRADIAEGFGRWIETLGLPEKSCLPHC
jgi:5'-nucleotidase